MPQIILIRHAETRQEAQRSAHEWILTPAGMARCQDLAQSLSAYGLSHIYSSVEAKATLTARLVAEELGIASSSQPGLQETKREHAPYYPSTADFQAHIQRAMTQPKQIIFGEESFSAALIRFSQAVDTLLKAHPQENIAIVTHGTVLSLFLGERCQRNSYEIWQNLGMPAYFVLNLPGWQLERSVYSLESL